MPHTATACRVAVTLLASTLGCAASAVVCNPTVPAPCVNTYQVFGQPRIELISDVPVTLGLVKLRYYANVAAVDSFITLRWSDASGATILSAQNMLGWFNFTAISWSSEFIGVFFPPLPSVALVTGKVDFTGSAPRPNDCPGGICDARYYDWRINAGGGGGGAGGGAGAALNAAHGAEATLVPPLPPGFEGVTETRATLQSALRAPADPQNPEAATYIDRFRFASRAQQDAAGWQYVYTFENLSADAVDFALDAVGFSGRAAAGSTVTLTVDADAAPGLLRATPTITRDAFTAASGRFDLLAPLQPVPELPSLVLLLAGLGGLGAVASRRRTR